MHADSEVSCSMHAAQPTGGGGAAHRGGDKGGVASEQLGAAQQHEQQAKGQAKGAVYHLLQTRVAGGQAWAGATDGDGQEGAKAYESAAQDAHQERLGHREPRFAAARRRCLFWQSPQPQLTARQGTIGSMHAQQHCCEHVGNAAAW